MKARVGRRSQRVDQIYGTCTTTSTRPTGKNLAASVRRQWDGASIDVSTRVRHAGRALCSPRDQGREELALALDSEKSTQRAHALFGTSARSRCRRLGDRPIRPDCDPDACATRADISGAGDKVPEDSRRSFDGASAPARSRCGSDEVRVSWSRGVRDRLSLASRSRLCSCSG